MVTSGTATLETALFGVPEVVCYEANWISYGIAKRLVKVDYISLVNLIMEKEAIKELIQNDFNLENLKTELNLIVHNDSKRSEILKEFEELKVRLGGPGASDRTARLIVSACSVSDE